MTVIENLIALCAPHICVGCGSEGEILCSACCLRIEPPVPQCYRCGVKRQMGRTCPDCLRSTPLVSVNTAAGYAGAAKELLWSLKFGRAQAAAQVIGATMADRYGQYLRPDTLIVPVPTANKRVRSRGYDQAVMIAKAFARHSGCTYAPLLRRYGAQEQKRANRQQRHEQLQGVFEVADIKRADAARIIVIDDVLTTGATLEEAARTLKQSGAKVVGGLVFARA